MRGKARGAGAVVARSLAHAWRRSPLLITLRRFEGVQRYALILGGDLIATALSLYLAFFLRFEGRIPPERVDQFLRCLPPLLFIRATLGVAFGTHRWSFRLSGIHEGMRLVHATLTGSVCFATAFYF